MLTFIDISDVYAKKQDVAVKHALGLEKTLHPNLLNLTEKVLHMEKISTLLFITESPDHISGWKQFCKTEFTTEQILNYFRQLTSAVAHLNSHGIIHRDVHPTRIHHYNGLIKFNMIALPYNFKKLLKRPSFSGHLNYSAPEFIQEK